MPITPIRCPRVGSLVALAAVLLPPVFAQDPMLKPSQVTESALVDALAIDGAPQSGTATRSIRPSLKPAGTAKPAGTGKASLLITFATASAELSAETVQTLEVVAKALQSDRLAGFVFRVEGHADPRGPAEYNLKLSEERAQAVVAYLSGKLGVPAERLTPVGKGATEPIDLQHPEAAENRRVTFVTTR
jgi:OOP family OmpA-OmpF porin